MKEVSDQIRREELMKRASNMFGNLVKAVVDVEKEILIVDAELHSDQEAYLLEQGSKQNNLWGINIYPELTGSEMWVDYFKYDNKYNSTEEWINKYFVYTTIASKNA